MKIDMASPPQSLEKPLIILRSLFLAPPPLPTNKMNQVLANSRVDIAAEKYDIPPLKRLAAAK
jgi:hypothetical protein